MSVFSDYMFTQADPPCPAGSTAYVIRTGDTFFTIAQHFGITVAALTLLNPGVNPASLQIGQQICVPATGTSPGSCLGRTSTTIKPGDTFYGLATCFGITLQALLAANPGIDPNRLVVGQTVCLPGSALPQPPQLIQTPLCSLLQPVLSVVPPAADIPIGSVTVRQVAMSTRAYTVVASPLPEPSQLGNFNSYVAVLNLITDDPASPRETVTIRLVSSSFGNQLITWAGTSITTYPPIVGDTAEIRPLNNVTGSLGPAILRGDITPCRS